MTCSCIVVSSEVFLHLRKFLFFAALLEVQQLHFGLESSFLLAQSLVFEFLLLQLSECKPRL
jgi:hypothetical protein